LQLTQTALDSAGDMALWIDREGRVVYANRMACEILGYSEEELLGLQVYDYDPIASLQDFQQSWDRVQNEGPVTFEATHRTKTGTMLPVEVSLYYLKFGDRELIASFSRDITERKEIEASLRESEKQYRRFFEAIENASEGIVLWGPDERLIMHNSGYKEIFGHYADIMEPGLLYEDFLRRRAVSGLVDEDPIKAENYIAGRLQDHRNKSAVIRELVRDDKIIHFRKEKMPDGSVITFHTDITQLKHREDLLRQAQKMEAVGQLTGGIAHDFNNMLAGLQGNLDLMSDGLSSQAEREERLIRAKAIVQRGADLTKHLLAFSRKQNLQPKAIDVGELVDHMGDLMQRSLGETITINMDFASDLWPAMVDPHQLENAILNLAINARDAMSNGGTLSVHGHNIKVNDDNKENMAGLTNGDYAVISVHDHSTRLFSKHQLYQRFPRIVWFE